MAQSLPEEENKELLSVIKGLDDQLLDYVELHARIISALSKPEAERNRELIALYPLSDLSPQDYGRVVADIQRMMYRAEDTPYKAPLICIVANDEAEKTPANRVYLSNARTVGYDMDLMQNFWDMLEYFLREHGEPCMVANKAIRQYAKEKRIELMQDIANLSTKSAGHLIGKLMAQVQEIMPENAGYEVTLRRKTKGLFWAIERRV